MFKVLVLLLDITLIQELFGFVTIFIYFCWASKTFEQVHLGDTPHNLTESDFEVLARKTEGFSGSDISVCVSMSLVKIFFSSPKNSHYGDILRRITP